MIDDRVMGPTMYKLEAKVKELETALKLAQDRISTLEDKALAIATVISKATAR